MKLSEQAQQKEVTTRPTRTARVLSKQKYLSQKRQVDNENKRIEKINSELKSFRDIANYENYQSEYNKLSSDAKQQVFSPQDLMDTDGYKKYLSEKNAYNVAVAKQKEAQSYNYDLTVAQKFYRKGLPPYMLGNKRQKEMYKEIGDSKRLYEQKILHPENYSTDLDVYKKNPELRQAVISGEVTPQITTGFSGTKVDFKQDPQATYDKWKATNPDIEIKAVEEKKTIFDKALDKISEYNPLTKYTIGLTGTSIPKITIQKKVQGDAGQKAVSSLIKAGYNAIPSPDIYITPPSMNYKTTLGIPTSLNIAGSINYFGKTTENDIKIADVKTIMTEDYEKKVVANEEILYKKIDLENIQGNITKQNQQAFDQKYMKDIIFGNIDFETASEEYKTSDEAKLLQKNYENTVKNELAGLGFQKEGFKIYGWETAKAGVSLIPSTTKGAVVTGVVAYSGYNLFKLIPASVINVGLGVGGTYGGYKAFSPTSTPTERASGLILAGTSAVLLGYSAYKYLGTPVKKPFKIKQPKANLRASEIRGKNVKIVTDEGVINKAVFEEQKISQFSKGGQGMGLTTKGRELTRKTWEYMGLKPELARNYIYEGIPTKQLGQYYSVEGLGTSFSYRTPSGYQNAVAKLLDYGYTPAQARATLRYTAPKIVEGYMKEGTLLIKGDKAFGKLKFTIEKPVITLDKSLGIKTRGGQTKSLIREIEREIIAKGDKLSLVLENRKEIIGLLPRGSTPLNILQREIVLNEMSLAKATKKYKGYDYLGKDQYGTKVWKTNAKMQDTYNLKLRNRLFNMEKDLSKTKLIDEIIDKTTKNYIYPSGTAQKTPLSKTFGTTGSSQSYMAISKTPSNFQKVINTLESNAVQGLSQVSVPNELYINPLKSLIKVKSVGPIVTTSDLAVLQASTFGLLIAQQTNILSKTNQKAKNDLKALLRMDTGLKIVQETKVAQSPQLKTSSALKSQLKSLLDLGTISSTPSYPRIRNPSPPDINPPPIKPFIIFPYLKTGISKKKQARFNKSIYEQAYLPDFTSRALGLQAETITQKQANKKLKQLLTGLEIRRGVIIQ